MRPLRCRLVALALVAFVFGATGLPAQNEATVSAQERELRQELAALGLALTKQQESLSQLLQQLLELQQKEEGKTNAELEAIRKELVSFRAAWLRSGRIESEERGRMDSRWKETLLLVEKGLEALRADVATLRGELAAAPGAAGELTALRKQLERLATSGAAAERSAEQQRFDAKLREDSFRKEIQARMRTLAGAVDRIRELAEDAHEARRLERERVARQQSEAAGRAKESEGQTSVFWSILFAALFAVASWFWIRELRNRRSLEDQHAALRLELSLLRDRAETLESAARAERESGALRQAPPQAPESEPQESAGKPPEAEPEAKPEAEAEATADAVPAPEAKPPIAPSPEIEPQAEEHAPAPEPVRAPANAVILAPPDAAAPRLLSIRIPEDRVADGAEEVIAALLASDKRVLLEPAPRLEQRLQGALSVRFYVRGDIEAAAGEDLRRACWDLGARSGPPDHRTPRDE